MAGTSLLALLDDIATVLDDIAVMTKVAAKKTAGVLGDDLALNAEQVCGIRAERELPVVWAVAKGSLRNKLILVPAALFISAVAPKVITPLLMVGGAYLCFEGFEKVAHKLLHGHAEEDGDHAAMLTVLDDPAVVITSYSIHYTKLYEAMDFLLNIQRRLAEHSWMERFGVLGKRVVVIGGGDTAMDCVRTAVREGAQSVTCLYRRDAANMPGSSKEYHNAVEEGVNFLFQATPQQLVLDEHGALAGVDAIRTLLGPPDADGRQRVEELPGSEHCVPADVVIMALGFDIAGLPWLAGSGVEQGTWGELLIDPATGRTSHPKVYAGGDCQRGADLAVTAAADGRRAALAIMDVITSYSIHYTKLYEQGYLTHEFR